MLVFETEFLFEQMNSARILEILVIPMLVQMKIQEHDKQKMQPSWGRGVCWFSDVSFFIIFDMMRM